MGDGTLYARAKGSGTKVVVLLHGFGGGCDDWYDIQPALVRDATALAYDLPGHGRSLDHPAAGSASGMAKAILADLETRDIAQAHLVGFSMGGAVATLMALRAPQQVASLTLLAPGGFGTEINQSVLSRFATPDGADGLRAVMNEMAAPDYAFDTRHVAALAARRHLAGQRQKLEEICGMIARDGRQGEIPRQMLAGLTMPVTVVWGTADPVLPYRQSDQLPSGFKLVSLPGVGHMLPFEAPGAVVSAVRATMSRA